ncbi:unnamed protein product [Rhizophagus irregularis]|nr:unnamed protein product [Rhizophagus irregularis]
MKNKNNAGEVICPYIFLTMMSGQLAFSRLSYFNVSKRSTFFKEIFSSQPKSSMVQVSIMLVPTMTSVTLSFRITYTIKNKNPNSGIIKVQTRRDMKSLR